MNDEVNQVEAEDVEGTNAPSSDTGIPEYLKREEIEETQGVSNPYPL